MENEYSYDIETGGLNYDYTHIIRLLFNGGNVDLNRIPVVNNQKFTNIKPFGNTGCMSYSNRSEYDMIMNYLKANHPSSYVYTATENSVFWANYHTVSDKHIFWSYKFEDHFTVKEIYRGWKTGLAYGV